MLRPYGLITLAELTFWAAWPELSCLTLKTELLGSWALRPNGLLA